MNSRMSGHEPPASKLIDIGKSDITDAVTLLIVPLRCVKCRKSDNPIDRYFFHDLIEVGLHAKGFQ
jgi:hypothetical protein